MTHHWLRPLVEMPLPLTILLKVTILLAVAWGAHLLLRQRNPHWRILLWRGAGMAIVAVPLLTWLTPAIPISVSAPAGTSTAAVVKTPLSPASDEVPVNEPSEKSANQTTAMAGTVAASPALTERIGVWIGDHWTLVCFTLWAAGISLLVARWAIVWTRLRQVLHASSAADEHERECLHRAARILGCDATVQLRIAEQVAGPLLAGIRRPVILLPRRMTLTAESGELSAILAHELTHLHNRDLPWMGLLRAIAVVCWWHPLAWVMCRAHGQACEEVCDARAAAHVGDRAAYSRTLARAALAALAPTPALAGVPMARPAEIMRRLSRLQAAPTKGSRPALRQIAAAAAAGAAFLFALSGLQLVYAATSTSPAVAPARVLHFPKDRSLGTVHIQDANLRREIETFYHWVDGVTIEWEKIGEAQGDVSIPAGQRVMLTVSREGWQDLSPLTRLAPDDIYALYFQGTGLSPEAGEERGFLPRAMATAGDGIMPHVTRLAGLKFLDLHTTEVTGSGLRHIERLKSLECLYVPPKMNDAGMNHVAKLTSLKRLYFKQNNVTNKGLARLADLRELEELELGGGDITDAGLIHLRKLPKLQYLCLWGRGFTDAGMVHVKEIHSLRTFHPVRSMSLGDEGLAHLSNLSHLERLSLYGLRQVTDAGVAHVARMTGLRQLDVSGTGIGDIGGEHLQKLENLELLHLSDDLSRPAMVALLATQPHLRDLRCAGSSNSTYGDEVLEQVGKMADLESLFVCGTQVTDRGVAFIAGCRKLKRLSFFGCPITNPALAEIGKLANLEELWTYNARFTTSGLKQLNGLSRLQQMRVSTVEADDGLMDISGLTSLRRLTISEMPHKGRQLRDGDLAFLKNLPQLEWLQVGLSFTDAGMAHIAGLTRLERISIGGEEVTDRGLAYLSGMKRLDNLTIQGNFTDKGLLQLEQNPSLAVLFLICPKRPDKVTVNHLTQNLPQLGFFSYGPDLQKMRPIKGGGGMWGGGFGAARSSRRQQ